MTRRWLARGLTGLALAAPAAWLAGFACFLHTAQQAPMAPPAHADGIVALTGAPGRIDAALRLLAEGRAERLLVSGVAAGATLEDIAPAAANVTIQPSVATQRSLTTHDSLAMRITLGHVATSTQGNARETAGWARAHNLRSLMVVTSAWHLPRAMAELARAMPNLALYPVAVTGEAEHGLTASPAGWRLLAGEYTKWLVVAAGLETVHPDRPRILPAADARPKRAASSTRVSPAHA